MEYVLKDDRSNAYFTNPSFESWKFTKNIAEATSFATKESAEKMRKTLELAILLTYWDWDDIEPNPVVEQKGG